jgi:hypothetical protein
MVKYGFDQNQSLGVLLPMIGLLASSGREILRVKKEELLY